MIMVKSGWQKDLHHTMRECTRGSYALSHSGVEFVTSCTLILFVYVPWLFTVWKVDFIDLVKMITFNRCTALAEKILYKEVDFFMFKVKQGNAISLECDTIEANFVSYDVVIRLITMLLG